VDTQPFVVDDVGLAAMVGCSKDLAAHRVHPVRPRRNNIPDLARAVTHHEKVNWLFQILPDAKAFVWKSFHHYYMIEMATMIFEAGLFQELELA
jgi:hypothetical protein